MLAPELLRLIAEWLREPIWVQDVLVKRLRCQLANVACVNRAWSVVGRKPVGEGHARFDVVAPQELFENWRWLKQATKVSALGMCVGEVVRELLSTWRIPAAFLSCDVDMLALVTGDVKLNVIVEEWEALVIVTDYLPPWIKGKRRSTARSSYLKTWMPTPRWLFKLPKQGQKAQLKLLLPPCEIVPLQTTGQVFIYEAI